jgi:hypothetical protein
MADHFDIAERKLAHAHEVSTRISEEFSSPDTDHKLVQSLASQKRNLIAEARAFGIMATAQALHDLYNLLDERLGKKHVNDGFDHLRGLGGTAPDGARIGKEIHDSLEDQ